MSTEAPSPRKSQVAGQSFTIGSVPEMSTKNSSSSAQAASFATRVRPIGDAVDSGVNCTSSVSKSLRPTCEDGTEADGHFDRSAHCARENGVGAAVDDASSGPRTNVLEL